MANKKYIAIISEGISSEKKIINNIKKNFFGSEENIIFLPFGAEIYQLWKKIKEDKYLDIMELLFERDESGKSEQLVNEIGGKDEISLIYLLFDYDGQSTCNYGNYSNEEIISSMLEIFNNETENGKIFISYPMVEAMRDLKIKDICNRRCAIDVDEKKYKNLVGNDSEFTAITSYERADWNHMICFAIKKASCLVTSKFEVFDYNIYIHKINQISIFASQVDKFISKGSVAILGGIPLFVIDYFGEELYNEVKKFDFNMTEYNIGLEGCCLL